MSYSIIYQIKAEKTLNGKFKLTYEVGDSNVYESFPKPMRRARGWQDETMITHGEEVSLKELEDKLNHFVLFCYEGRCDPNDGVSFEDYKKGFGWYEGLALTGKHTSKTTWNNIKNIYLRATKKEI